MDKIYSRPRLLLPKVKTHLHLDQFGIKKITLKNKNNRKIISIICVLIIALITMNKMIEAINVIVDKQCKAQAKSIATKISNQQATAIMAKYKYDELFNVVKDSNREYIYD